MGWIQEVLATDGRISFTIIQTLFTFNKQNQINNITVEARPGGIGNLPRIATIESGDDVIIFRIDG